MTGNKFYFSSADKTIRVHAVEWLPVGEPKAVLQIFAGHAEQILRYEELAEYFISHGFAVIRSEHFAQEEVQFCVKSIKKKYPDIPCLLLGICQGVPVVNEFALNHPEAVEGVVLADAEQELHPISKELPVLRISGTSNFRYHKKYPGGIKADLLLDRGTSGRNVISGSNKTIIRLQERIRHTALLCEPQTYKKYGHRLL